MGSTPRCAASRFPFQIQHHTTTKSETPSQSLALHSARLSLCLSPTPHHSHLLEMFWINVILENGLFNSDYCQQAVSLKKHEEAPDWSGTR